MFEKEISFLEKLLGESSFSSSTREATFYCKFCKHYKKKFSVNVETFKWQCFRCGRKGVTLDYLVKSFGKSYQEEYLSLVGRRGLRKSILSDDDKNFSLELPKEYVPITPNNKNSFVGRRFYKYLRERGLSDKDIVFHKIGYALYGNFRGRLIFPSFAADGSLNFFTTRSIGESYCKYLDPQLPRDYKKRIIVNELNIDWGEPVVLVEGFFDMYKVNNAAVLLGSTISPESKLFYEIVKNKSKVLLGLDKDATMKKWKIAKQFLGYNVEVYDVDLGKYNDIGEMSKEESGKLMKRAKLWDLKNVFLDKIRYYENRAFS